MNAQPVQPIPSATLLLVRDGARGLEVMMIGRHEASGFAAGALVFPGGKIDAEDRALAARCPGIPADAPFAPAFYAAAIREAWEECGLLLARRRGAARILTGAEIAALNASDAVGAICRHADLELATDLLVPFAHWITPVDRPKRFDTAFFIASFDGAQDASHDGRESVEARWVHPADALAGAETGAVKLVFATRMNLMKLARFETAAAALDAARAQPIVTVVPNYVTTARGAFFRIPANAGYETTELSAEGIPRA